MKTAADSGAGQRVLLSIAGFDPSNGAGFTADLLTFAAHGFFGTSAATALTVQSTTGVFGVEAVRPEVLRRTIEELVVDLPPSGVKIGMLSMEEAVHVTSVQIQALGEGIPRKLQIPTVFDPVLRSSSGTELLAGSALDLVHGELLPLVDWITPNWAELAILSGMPVNSDVTAEKALHRLGSRHANLSVVATGGDQARPVDIVRLPSGEMHRLDGEHIESRSTHGTGCAFSSALLCRLVLGDEPLTAVAGRSIL